MSSEVVRRRRRRRRGRRQGARSRRVVLGPNLGSVPARVRFRTQINQAIANTAVSLMSYQFRCDNVGDRVTAISDAYELWRPVAVRVYAFSELTPAFAGSGALCITYHPNLKLGLPTTFDEAVDEPTYVSCSLWQRCSFTLGGPELRGSETYNWYFTRDQGNDDRYVAGVFTVGTECTANASTSDVVVVIEGELEFKGSVDPDINPAPRGSSMHVMDDEKSVVINVPDTPLTSKVAIRHIKRA